MTKLTADNIKVLLVEAGLELRKTANVPLNLGVTPELALERAISKKPIPNATFYTFKMRGKYYTHARGHIPGSVFTAFKVKGTTRERVLEANGGSIPGMSSAAPTMAIFVVLDEDVDYGWPLYLLPTEVDA